MNQVLVRVSGVVECEVVTRPTRFTVVVRVGGAAHLAYNTNTGRLEDVLRPGARGYCVRRRGGRTAYRLLAVEYAGGFAVTDTRLQEDAFAAAMAALGTVEDRGSRTCRVTLDVDPGTLM